MSIIPIDCIKVRLLLVYLVCLCSAYLALYNEVSIVSVREVNVCGREKREECLCLFMEEK